MSDALKGMPQQFRNVADPRLKESLENIVSNIKRMDRRISSLESPAAPAWQQISLLASWDNYSDDAVQAEHHIDNHSFVHIHMVIAGGTITDSTVIGVLPEGSRPENIVDIYGDDGAGAHSSLRINPNGDLEIYDVTDSTRVSFSGVFYASR